MVHEVGIIRQSTDQQALVMLLFLLFSFQVKGSFRMACYSFLSKIQSIILAAD